MDARRTTVDGHGPYGDLRRQVDDTCGRVGPARVALEAARSTLTEARRAAARVQRAADEARADSDPARVNEAKTEARAAYQAVIAAGADTAAVQRAAEHWLSTIDQLNRDSRRAARRLARAESEGERLRMQVVRAEREADAARIAAESAVAACAEARQALAAADTAPEVLAAMAAMSEPPGRAAPTPRVRPAASSLPFEDDIGSSDDDLDDDLPGRHPVMAERIVEGDREALQEVAREVAHLTGQPVSHYILLLQGLIEALERVAVERFYLAIDDRHALWSQFDQAERLAVIHTLADLGFRLDPQEGWEDGRVPASGDLAMAFAYAGRDPRTLRRMPTQDEVRALPASVRVMTLDLLAALAPDLTLQQMLDLLGARGDAFSLLWDDWGRITPILLSEAATPVSA